MVNIKLEAKQNKITEIELKISGIIENYLKNLQENYKFFELSTLKKINYMISRIDISLSNKSLHNKTEEF